MATQNVTTLISEVSICNLALGWLGVGEITSLDDPRTEAELCKNNYPMIRDAVIEEGMWSFATRRDSSLDQVETDPWGVLYKHPKPLNWLQVLRVYSDVQATKPTDWVSSEGWFVEDNHVLAPDASIWMVGVVSVPDTNKFTHTFAQCLAARIAADLAIPITQNRQLQVDMWKLYEAKLNIAFARDGQQMRNERLRAKRLLRAR